MAELLIKPFLLSPRLLDLAERVMGPFVQGDGFYVVGSPPAQLTGRATGVASREELLAEAAGWHRDAYNHHNLWRSNPGYADDLADGGSRSRRRWRRTCSATCRTWTARGGHCSQSRARTAPRSAKSRSAPRRRR